MRRAWNTCVAGVLAWLAVSTGTSLAESGNDLLSAPSVVSQRETTPPAPSSTHANSNADDPAQSEASAQPHTQQPDTQHPNTATKTQPKPPDQTAVHHERRPTSRRQVNEVSAVFTLTDKHN